MILGASDRCLVGYHRRREAQRADSKLSMQDNVEAALSTRDVDWIYLGTGRANAYHEVVTDLMILPIDCALAVTLPPKSDNSASRNAVFRVALRILPLA